MHPRTISEFSNTSIGATRDIAQFATLLDTISPDGRGHGARPVRAASARDADRVRSVLLLLDCRTFRRRALQSLLEAQRPDLRVIGHLGAEGLAACAGAGEPQADLLLLNIGGASIADAGVVGEVAEIRTLLPGMPIILLGDLETSAQVDGAIRLGVEGYVPTSADPAVVISVLLLVKAGGTYLPAIHLPEVAAKGGRDGAGRPPSGDAGGGDPSRAPCAAAEGMVRRAGAPARLCEVRFTQREREVLHCLGQGLPNKLIAHELDLRESTVKVHVRNILKKLNVQSRTQAALFAFEAASSDPQTR